MVDLTRRQALKALSMAAGISALETIGIYSWIAGADGMKEDLRHISRNDVNPGYFIADSHAHPAIPNDAPGLERLLKHLFESKVIFQSLSAIEAANYMPYEMLKENLTGFCASNKEYNLQMSDEHCTVVSNQGRKLAFVRSQEVVCLSPYGKEVHVCAEGMPYFQDLKHSPEEVIEKGLESGSTIILNHPYAVSHKLLKYWIASGKDEEYIKGLMRYDGLIVEAFNSLNVWHMAASNGKGEAMAKEHGKAMTASTDCHNSRIELTLKQLGHAGFYVEYAVKSAAFSAMSGKEIIDFKKSLAINSPGLLKNYVASNVFFRVMVMHQK